MDLEKRVDTNTNDIQKMNDVLRQLIELSGSHTEQIEKMLFGIDESKGNIRELRESQKETQEKLNALIDAQIRGEDQMRELREVVKLAH